MITIGTLKQAQAIAKTAGMFFNLECDQAIVRVEGEELLGGVIYQGFTGASIRAHIAGFTPRWIDRDMLWMMFHYPFEQLGVSKIIGHVHSTNLKALDFNRKLGFKEEARIEGVFRDADLVIMSMRREDCRWLERGKRRELFK
jgi:RimJ/RimL family protein N-acetyltransferase